MLLTVDIGNSNIVLGVYEGKELRFISRLVTARDKSGDEMAVNIKSVLHLYGVDGDDFEGAIVSSVVPPVTAAVVPALQRITGKTPLVVGPGLHTGLNIRIDNPAQLGADIAVDAVAAMARYPLPLIVCDLGTATTISVINAKGELIGCSIHPGVRLSLEALSGRAAQLPVISIDAPSRVIGKNTIDSMRSGAVYGAAAMLDGMVLRMEEEIGQPCTVVATGGLAGEITKQMRREVHYDPDLLLEGLRLLYEKNK